MTGVYRRDERGAFKRQPDVPDEMPEPQPWRPETRLALERIDVLERRVDELEREVAALRAER
jgi:hypothetical protein